MFSFLLLSFISCNEKEKIFKQVYNNKIIVLDASGSSKQDINGSLQMTKPEYAIYPWNKRYDWCSNCGKTYSDHPYLTFSLKNKKFKVSGYFLRAGCCYSRCCCEDNGYCVHCCPFSWALQISNDNKTWTDIHKIEKDYEMRYCKEKSYNFDKTYEAKYIRLIQTEACPGDPPCIALNQIEFFGSVIDEGIQDDEENFVSYHDDDDDVSIIGHISKNGNVKVN